MSYFDRLINRMVRQAVNEAMKPVRAEFKGKIGEAFTSFAINISELCGIKGKQLNNLYIPTGNNKTAEIDIVYIAAEGVFVIENKSYSGFVEGDVSQRNWTFTSAAGRKYGMYNPVMQNKSHIRALKGSIAGDLPFIDERGIPFFSVIVFSDTAALKIAGEKESETVIVNRSGLVSRLAEFHRSSESLLSESEIADIYDKLKGFENPGRTVEEEHKKQVANARSKGAANTTGELCPRCGKALVIRTVKSGARAGQKFIGCSGFPGCRFTRNYK